MLESSIESVAYVCRAEVARLRELVRELDQAEPRQLESILRALGKTSDTLSAALSRVSAYADHLESDADETASRKEPTSDAGLVELVRRSRIAVNFGFCRACGGVLHDGGEHGRVETIADKDAATRARQRASDAR